MYRVRALKRVVDADKFRIHDMSLSPSPKEGEDSDRDLRVVLFHMREAGLRARVK